MTCREFTDFIDDFLSRNLPSEQRLGFERHLQRCANCTRYLERYRSTVALGKGALRDVDAAVPDEVPKELIEAILRARRTPLRD